MGRMGPLAALGVPMTHALSLTVIGDKVLRSMSTFMLHSGFVCHKEEIETDASCQQALAVRGSPTARASCCRQPPLPSWPVVPMLTIVLLTVAHHSLTCLQACNSGNPRKAQACRVLRNVVLLGNCQLLRTLFFLQRQVQTGN